MRLVAMVGELVAIALAGLAAGLGVAMPLGAVGVLIVRQGTLYGFRSALVAASAVAIVDTLYCAVAVFVGRSVAPVVSSWGSAPLYISGAVIVLLGVYQLLKARRSRPSDEVTATPTVSNIGVFLRFLALTAINPLTLVYFFALAGAVTMSTESLASVVFIAAVGLASFVWQAGLAVVGSVLHTSVSKRTGETLDIVASLVIVALGLVVIVRAAIGVG